MAEEIRVKSPDGVISIVSRKLFDAVLKYRGFVVAEEVKASAKPRAKAKK